MKRFLISLLCACVSAGFVQAKSKSQDARPPVTLKLDVDRPVLPANQNEHVVIKISLDALRSAGEKRAPVNLAMVIDCSGSMSGDKINQAREAALEAVRMLQPDDIVSLVTYNDRVETVFPAQKVGDGQEISRKIESIHAEKDTNLYGGVCQGAAEIRKYLDSNYVNRILLLSDGLANVGPSAPDDLGRLGAGLMKESIPVSTIGLGLGYNEDLMTRLALRSDGNTYFVENSRDLPSIFQKELGEGFEVVARDLVVEIHLPKGVKPIRFIGREGRIEKGKAVMEISQLNGGRQKFALLEVEVPPSPETVRLDLASADLRYVQLSNGKTETQNSGVTVTFDKDMRVVVKNANAIVQKDWADNLVAEVRMQALDLKKEGQTRAAIATLKQANGFIEANAVTYGNSAMVGSAASLNSDMDLYFQKDLSEADKKKILTEASQTFNQQTAP